MDTTGFFDYPTEPEARSEHGLPGFLSDRGDEDWAMLLDHTETRLFVPGEVVLRPGERDRALYLLVMGWVKAPSGVVHPITTLGEGAFLDGARNPALGRDILLDVGRILSARLHALGDQTAGWTG